MLAAAARAAPAFSLSSHQDSRSPLPGATSWWGGIEASRKGKRMFRRRLRTIFAAIVGGAVLVGGLAAGVAFAKADDSGTAAAGGHPGVASSITVYGRRADEAPLRRGNLTQEEDSTVKPSPLRTIADGLVTDIGNMLGLDLNDVFDQLSAGTPLGDVLQSLGLDVDQVAANVRELVLQRIDAAVADGRMSEDEAARLRDLVARFDVTTVSPRVSVPGLEQLPGGLPRLLDQLGINLDDLRAELESGVSLSDALGNLGVDLSALAEQAQNEVLARIDQLEADGRISSDRADQLRQRIEDFDFENNLRFELSPPNEWAGGPGRLGGRQLGRVPGFRVDPFGRQTEGAGLGV